MNNTIPIEKVFTPAQRASQLIGACAGEIMKENNLSFAQLIEHAPLAVSRALSQAILIQTQDETFREYYDQVIDQLKKTEEWYKSNY